MLLGFALPHTFFLYSFLSFLTFHCIFTSWQEEHTLHICATDKTKNNNETYGFYWENLRSINNSILKSISLASDLKLGLGQCVQLWPPDQKVVSAPPGDLLEMQILRPILALLYQKQPPVFFVILMYSKVSEALFWGAVWWSVSYSVILTLREPMLFQRQQWVSIKASRGIANIVNA